MQAGSGSGFVFQFPLVSQEVEVERVGGLVLVEFPQGMFESVVVWLVVGKVYKKFVVGGWWHGGLWCLRRLVIVVFEFAWRCAFNVGPLDVAGTPGVRGREVVKARPMLGSTVANMDVCEDAEVELGGGECVVVQRVVPVDLVDLFGYEFSPVL